MGKTIGVIVTTFNSSAFVLEALQSISNQTRRPDEVLIVDDCSEDETLQICARWATEQPFEVHCISNTKREGIPGVGREMALRASTSALLALLDHDDKMAPECLLTLSQAFDFVPGLVLAFADAIEEEEGGADGLGYLRDKQHALLPFEEFPHGFRRLEGDVLTSLLPGSYVPTMASMWSRCAAIEVGGFSPKTGTADDGHLWMRLALIGCVGYYPRFLGHKRIHESNLSHKRNSLRLCMDLRACINSLLGQAELLRLSDDQQRACSKRRAELEREATYHASRNGVRAYRNVLRDLGYTNMRIKELAAALIYTIAPHLPRKHPISTCPVGKRARTKRDG